MSDDNDSGWIKLHRKLRDHPRKTNPNWMAVWIDVLLRAQWAPSDFVWKGKRVTLKPGQFIASAESIGKTAGVPRSSTDRYLRLMESEQELSRVVSSAGCLYSVVNWDKYQEGEQRMGNGWVTDEQRMGNGWVTDGHIQEEEEEEEGEEGKKGDQRETRACAREIPESGELEDDRSAGALTGQDEQFPAPSKMGDSCPAWLERFAADLNAAYDRRGTLHLADQRDVWACSRSWADPDADSAAIIKFLKSRVQPRPQSLRTCLDKLDQVRDWARAWRADPGAYGRNNGKGPPPEKPVNYL